MIIVEIQLTFSHGFKFAVKKLSFKIEPETGIMNLSVLPAIWLHCRQLGHSFPPMKWYSFENETAPNWLYLWGFFGIHDKCLLHL